MATSTVLKSPMIAAEIEHETSIYTGDAVGLFSSGSAPTGSHTLAGDGVEMFTTSCIIATSDQASGDKVELFTTSC